MTTPVTTFDEFFGGSFGGVPVSDSENGSTGASIEYSGHLQLEHYGVNVTYVELNGSLSTFRAIVYKERNEKKPTGNGWEEMVLRDLAFPANNTTGRESILIHREMRVGTSRYQIMALQRKQQFWHVTLERISVGEVGRNRRGRM